MVRMELLVTISFAVMIYSIALVLYRLFFAPLACIPGPKLAAITGWYETYYEVFQKLGGQYTFRIKEMHKEYGM
jgi:hypothetical protein